MKKSFEMTPRRKRQTIYLGLFAMATIYALTNHDGAWLAIALAAALIVDEIMYFIDKRRYEKKRGNSPELIETTAKDVENSEDADTSEPQDSEK